MGEVINMPKNAGAHTFVLCHCKPGGVPVTPVVLQDQSGPIIVSLMCTECERVVPVVNGIIQEGSE